MLKECLKKNDLDALWITDEKSIEFLFNEPLHCGERFVGVLITPQRNQIVLNKLFSVSNPELEIVWVYDYQDINLIINELTPSGRIGLDKNMRAQFVLPLIQERSDIEWVIGSDCVDQLRAIKTEDQIQKMIKASQLNDLVMSEVKAFIEVGMTEKEIEQFIHSRFKHYGTQPSFETIVAFGQHANDPHAIPSDLSLKEGQSIVVDMGCVVDGYCSDMTRTFYVNDISHPDIYNLVLKANKAAIEAIKPGITFSELDGIARTIITEGGYGEYFTHRLGHGIGREVHEPYDVSGSNHQPVLPGMCFSIEPGIYHPDFDGVRIEDLVYVNESGVGVRLNHFDKENPIIS